MDHPMFHAISSSARQLQLLLRCIAFANKAQIRLSPQGLRVSTEEGSVMEAFVSLDKSLFTSYTYNAPTSQDGPPEPSNPPMFQINLASLLETLNIFSLSDPSNVTGKRPGGGDAGYDSLAAHRLQRHAGINAFASQHLQGICTLSYAGAGEPLSVHMTESGVSTTCDLTTYDTLRHDSEDMEEIPFARDELALKTIMRSHHLLDAVQELSAFNPTNLTLTASPSSSRGPELSLSASGALGSASVEFTTSTDSDTPVLETFQCRERATASFKFALLKSAQRAMAAAAKVSVRLDREGVLSLQFLVEVEGVSGAEGVAFVDFRMVPLVEGEVEVDGEASESESESD